MLAHLPYGTNHRKPSLPLGALMPQGKSHPPDGLSLLERAATRVVYLSKFCAHVLTENKENA